MFDKEIENICLRRDDLRKRKHQQQYGLVILRRSPTSDYEL